MSSLTSFREIPIVDVSRLVAGDLSASSEAVNELRTVARTVGFLYVTGHGVPQRLFDDLLSATKHFFALPMEQKMSVYIGKSRNHRGYVPAGEEVFYGRHDRFERSVRLVD